MTKPPPPAAPSRAGWLAGFASALWVGLVAVLWRGDGTGTSALALAALAAALPVVMLWLAVALHRGQQALRQDIAALRDRPEPPPPPTPEDLAAALVARMRAEPALADSALGVFASTRTGTTLLAETQPSLALGAMAAADPPAHADLIRALHFPEDAEDHEGFAALRRCLAHHSAGPLIRSAQQVVTALAEEGIFMDDLPTAPAPPALWRAFADGLGGPEVAGLAGLEDVDILDRTIARMRSDAAFRNDAHRFLRGFDDCLRATAPRMEDTDLARLTDTRSARAFVLLGQATGAFGR
ncbi:hypothetical protein HUK65_02150 [Rhodobacteraceae bacterium 2376]|uniref:Uncharacterized protein n=1 Tax=Rhabdonatronobacter sediminivivens TaxID=2743469 RepID=A0A7Z0HXB6_9RHOB|nr:hypothetical protein [Rhabdonatronobacter sediminivivens]NYS23777.1 hypothetical protein [Rhabdonatronobacter sediminivivens]